MRWTHFDSINAVRHEPFESELPVSALDTDRFTEMIRAALRLHNA